jgi:hypothetical protein
LKTTDQERRTLFSDARAPSCEMDGIPRILKENSMPLHLASGTTTKKRPKTAIVISLIAGLLILAGGVGRVIVDSLVFSSTAPSWLRGLLDQAYFSFQSEGLNGPFLYVTAPIEIISGILILIGVGKIYVGGPRSSRWGFVIIGFSFASLVGSGGLGIGAVLGIIGGSLVILQ